MWITIAPFVTPDVPAATDAAVISRFINALKARIDAYQKRK
nr:inovirus Gp2 family protein [Escherichia coli]